ncbi:MAG: serine/threonine protein kinase [Rubripirellula sp.]
MSEMQGTATSPALDAATRSFVRRSLAAGLVEIDDLKKVVMSLMTDTGSEEFTPQKLAGGLVGAGILTQWQANKLLAGKKKGFYLGSYRLLRPLGKGGMGVVYLGEHHVMKRLMALKILPPESTRDVRRIERFKEEARACAQLDHPNIVRAYDFSEASGKLAIVMEYVDGIDLQHAVERDGVMAIVDAVDVLTQAAEGLGHAHERGIIHRDIKPSNLLLRTDGVVKVSDLGLARIGWSEGVEDKRLIGTADFIAPEQALSCVSVDARADIYSLGCSLFFLLTGKTPFTGTSAQRLAKHQTAPVPDIRKLREDCPVGLAELVSRMMAKRPEDRPKSAAELLAQIKRLSGVVTSESHHGLRQVSPATDTVFDDAVYQATIDDTSLSADGEVEISYVKEIEEIDFGCLPPVDLNALASTPISRPAKPVGKQAAKRKGRQQDGQDSNQQLLLGFGLAISVVALLVVLGVAAYMVMKPIDHASPRWKATEDNSGNVIVLRNS